MIRLLIVDDSSCMRLFLEHIFSSDPEISVVGAVCNGEDALAAVESLAPDVITMDIFMPGMNGLETTRRIMEVRPVPIVILSGNLDPDEVRTSFQAMEAGALTALPKPPGVGHPDHERSVEELVRKVKLMSEVKVIRRWPRTANAMPSAQVRHAMAGVAALRFQAVAIGASTGGPVAIQTILSGLDEDFPAPVLIVQHMAPGFIHGFAQWLALSCRLPVHVASPGEHVLPGHVYIAPDGFQMLLESGGVLKLSGDPAENGLRPSVSSLFRSVARACAGNAVGILLTGMGRDGADDLLAMKARGAVTIVQDEASSVIYGMPAEAVRIGAAGHVLPPDGIVRVLRELTGKSTSDRSV